MKRFIALILSVVLIFSLTGCNGTKSKELWESEPAPKGGIHTTSGLYYLDPEDPTLDRKSVSKEITLSDGSTGKASMTLPILNVDLDGTKEISDLIKSDYEEKYGDYFKDPDDKVVKVSYRTEYENDILIILMDEEITTTEGSYTTTYSYYYDALADVTLNMTEFTNTNGAQLGTVFDALYNDEWTKKYKEETGEYPDDHAVTAISCKGDLVFDLYCTNADGKTQSKITVQAEDVPIDFSGLEIGA